MESKLQPVIPVFLLIYRVDKREVIILSLLFSLYMIVVAFNTTTLVCLLC